VHSKKVGKRSFPCSGCLEAGNSVVDRTSFRVYIRRKKETGSAVEIRPLSKAEKIEGFEAFKKRLEEKLVEIDEKIEKLEKEE
jgi:hypothetical protein